jgi:hypothetical protein
MLESEMLAFYQMRTIHLIKQFLLVVNSSSSNDAHSEAL